MMDCFLLPLPLKSLHQIYNMSKQRILAFIEFVKNKGFFDLLSVNFLTQFLGFGSSLLVARFLTATELGEIRILQSYIAVFSIIASFGINTATLKLCSENRPEKEKASILNLAVRKSLLSILITLIILFALSLTGTLTSTKRLSFWLIIYAFVIPSDVLTNLFIVFLQSQKRIKKMARSQAIIKLQTLPIVIFTTWQFGFKGFIFSTIFAHLIGLWPLINLVGLNFLKIPIEKKPAQFMNFALFSLLANGVGQISLRGDMFILDHYAADRESIGYYSLALIFISAASQITGTVQSITTPYFSEKAEDEIWFRKQLALNQKRMVILSVVVALGVFILARIIIPIVYGNEYLPTIKYLLILLLRYIIWSSYAIIGPALIGLGQIKYNFLVTTIITPIGLFLSYYLLQQHGIIGVSWAQVGTALIQLSLMYIISKIAIDRKFN